MVSDAFASVLRPLREHLNQQYATARRQYGELDRESFTTFLTNVVDPLVQGTADLDLDQVSWVAQAAYEVGLALAGQRLIGPSARQPSLERGLSDLLPHYVHLVARAPTEVLPALCNALHHVGATPGARPAFFVQELVRLAPEVGDTETLLRAGQVTAWRAGLAHYREGALQRAFALGERLGKLALGAPEAQDWSALVARLECDPWFDPASGERAPARWVGGFRGFGGPFLAPPRVAVSAGRVLVESAGIHWLLIVDGFGATLHRATDAEVSNREKPHVDVRFQGKARLEVPGAHSTLAARGELTSAVITKGATVLGFASSHELLCLPTDAST